MPKHPSSDLAHILQRLGGGAHKRVDENRELLQMLQMSAPEFLEAHPWVVGWIKCNDEVFMALARMSSEQGLRDGERFGPRPNFPRPWPETPTITKS